MQRMLYELDYIINAWVYFSSKNRESIVVNSFLFCGLIMQGKTCYINDAWEKDITVKLWELNM